MTQFENKLNTETRMFSNLYIHIPFCIKKCLYCNFYSIPFESKLAKEYINALRREIELRKDVGGNLKTIYIGGGTPTILAEKEISEILYAVRDNYTIASDAEVTIEANPQTISLEKAKRLLDLGINRISIGIQSLDDTELMLLGRLHNSDDAIRALKDVKIAGFRNVSIDLLYGIPFPKFRISNFKSLVRNWQYTIENAIELEPQHISAYELTPEENTPLYDDIQKGRIIMPDEELISEMYYKCIEMLTANGYVHYEISNFAKPDFECRHNLNYWDRGEYLGIGAGAHSFLNGKRAANLKDASGYIKAIKGNSMPLEDETEITSDEAIKEFIFLGLRKTVGIDLKKLPQEIQSSIKKAVGEMSSYGLVEYNDDYLRLSQKGLLLSSEVIVRVLLGIEMPHLS